MISRKIYSTCKQTKSIFNFNKRKISKDGYRNQCKQCCYKLFKKNYNKNNKKQYLKKYYRKNKVKILKQNNKYKNNKYRNNINYKIECILRSRLILSLNRNTKSKSTLKLLSCSLKYLKEHLQKTAIQNEYLSFNINNYSGKEYHIDHIIPCSHFDLSKPEEQEKCFHYSNLQILTAKDNLNKSNKIIIF